MGAIAKPLSKNDMQNLAAHFSSLPGPLTHRK
jgi:cytochrome c553